MNEFFAWLSAHKNAVIASLGALSACLAALQSFLMWRMSHSFSKYLKDAKDRDTFTVCPHCHKEIKLSQIEFRLPDGSLDNDLDGRPD